MHVGDALLAGAVPPSPPEVVRELDAQDAELRRRERHSGHSFLAIGGPMRLLVRNVVLVLGVMATAKATKKSFLTLSSARVANVGL